jgi:hypothetical protein
MYPPSSVSHVRIHFTGIGPDSTMTDLKDVLFVGALVLYRSFASYLLTCEDEQHHIHQQELEVDPPKSSTNQVCHFGVKDPFSETGYHRFHNHEIP